MDRIIMGVILIVLSLGSILWGENAFPAPNEQDTTGVVVAEERMSPAEQIHRITCDWLQMGLKGKVKEYSHEEIGEPMDYHLYNFSPQGLIVYARTADPEGSTETSYRYQYDAWSRLARIEMHSMSYHWTTTASNDEVTFYYDSEGYLEKTVTSNDEEGSTIERYWNREGLLMRTNISDSQGITDERFYTYDYAGNLIEEVSYDQRGHRGYNCEMEYDLQGYKVKSTEYGSEGEIYRTEFYTYDEQGNPVNIKEYDGVGILLSEQDYAYTYDAHANPIEVLKSYAGDPDSYEVIRKITIVYY